MSIPCHVRSRAISTIIILFDMSRRPTVVVRVMPNYTRRQSYLYTIFDPPCTVEPVASRVEHAFSGGLSGGVSLCVYPAHPPHRRYESSVVPGQVRGCSVARERPDAGVGWVRVPLHLARGPLGEVRRSGSPSSPPHSMGAAPDQLCTVGPGGHHIYISYVHPSRAEPFQGFGPKNFSRPYREKQGIRRPQLRELPY